HLVMRNMLATSANAGWLRVKLVDARGRQTLAGAEVRVYAAGTREVVGTRFVDTGSGYNAQNLMPLHFGLGAKRMIDVETVVPRAGKRLRGVARNVDARE